MAVENFPVRQFAGKPFDHVFTSLHGFFVLVEWLEGRPGVRPRRGREAGEAGAVLRRERVRGVAGSSGAVSCS